MKTIIFITVLIGKKPADAEYRNICSKGYTNNWRKEIFVINSVLKTDTWTHEIKNLIRETTIGSFYEKELLLSKL